MSAAVRPTRAERQAATRAALLRAASHAIRAHGMDRASVELIATQAGYTKGAFYANFASKEQMFLAMLDAKFGEVIAIVEASLERAGDPLELSRHAGEEFLRYVERDPEWPRLYQEFAVHAARNERFRAEFAARQRALRDRLAEVFARWTRALGVEPALPHADVAAMIHVMADGFVLNRIIDPELDDRLYLSMREVFMRGLQAMSEAAQPAGAQPVRAQPAGAAEGAVAEGAAPALEPDPAHGSSGADATAPSARR